MRFEVNVEDQYTEFKLLEENLNSRISPDLKAEFVKRDFKNLVLNLSMVKYADSSGLSAILRANKLCMDKEGMLVICCVQPHVEKLITISQLQTVLTLLPTSEEAIEAIFMHEIETEITQTGGDLDGNHNG
ncbi:MAG: STAS domain-containing protein [Bacteroidota bacterium]